MASKAKHKYGADNPHWDEFVKWADNNGVDLTHQEDWGVWWECWYDGFLKGAGFTER